MDPSKTPSYVLLVFREDGSYYGLEGTKSELLASRPKDDIFGKVVSTKLLRRRPDWR